MLNEHTLDQLRGLRLDGMVPRHRPMQATSTAAAELGFDERLTLLVQREIAWRDDKRAGAAAQGGQAQGQQRLHRGHQLARLARRWTATSSPRWPAATGCATRRNVLITGATGMRQDLAGVCAGAAGRALGLHGAVHARRRGCSRSCALRTATAASRGGWRSWPASTCWPSTTSRSHRSTAAERNDLLELLDDRVGTRATLITSQLPVNGLARPGSNDPTLADAILDRIVHAAHKIALKGESMRKKQVKA